MDVLLPFEQVHSCYKTACLLTSPTQFKQKIQFYESFSVKRNRTRAPFSQFRCSLLEKGLKPRPMPRTLKEEENVFKKDVESQLEETHLESPNSIHGICGQIEKLVVCKMYTEALELFEFLECRREDDVTIDTYDALVSACIGSRSISGAKKVISHMLDTEIHLDLYMMNRVLLMLVKCGMMIDARYWFKDMRQRNVVSWNTLIGGLVDTGEYVEAFELFLVMRKDDLDIGSRTLALMIRASSGLELISPGEQLHTCALKLGVNEDVFVTCSLLDMYSKCGNLESAKLVFNVMPEKTTVGWNSIIAGHALHGYSEEALSMYYEMQDSGVKMDHFTYSIIVGVCTRLAALEHGKQAHAGLVRNGFGSDIVANTALVNFYCKWGRIEDATNVFEKMPKKNVMSWNALISGYGTHGRGAEAIELFEQMIRRGMSPNHVTFLAVLSACCYSGFFNQGWQIFESMSRDYKVKPRAMHYACMVELLGRKGLLNEAYEFIILAPFEPTLNMWAALLTACRIHKNIELGKHAAEKLYGMGPEKLSNYIALLNIYNASGKLKEASEVLQALRRKGLRMLPACTWIEIKKQQHVFCTDDKSHPQTTAIYDNLDAIMVQVKEQGYIPYGGRTFLPDVDEYEESDRTRHSERLAISFGLISTPGSTPLQLVQGHRICDDCHNVIKLISFVRKREIVFRDAGRFHRFKDGVCSCGDYW